jgi:hypothetical protein
MTRVEWREKCMKYATRGGFCGFGPQNLGRSSEERTTRGGIEELTSRLNYLMKDTVVVGSRLYRFGLECPYS